MQCMNDSSAPQMFPTSHFWASPSTLLCNTKENDGTAQQLAYIWAFNNSLSISFGMRLNKVYFYFNDIFRTNQETDKLTLARWLTTR